MYKTLRSRLLILAVALTLAIGTPVLARYSVCYSVYADDCLQYRTCSHYNDDGLFIGRVEESHEC